MRKEELSSTQSRMSFYSQLSHLRRSAITKYSQNQNVTELRDSYQIYIIGLRSSHKQQLIRTFCCAMENKLGQLRYIKQNQGLNIVELTPNRQYNIKGDNGRNLQVRRGTVLIEPKSFIEPKNIGFFEHMLEQKGCFPFCAQRQTKGDSVVLTFSLATSLSSYQKTMLRNLIQTYKSLNISIFIVLTHFDSFNKQIKTLLDAERLQKSILSVQKDLMIQRQKIFLLQCYSNKDNKLNDEINFYALQIVDQVMKSCYKKQIQKPKGWFCGLFN